MTVTAYSQVWSGDPISLPQNVPTVITRLILPNTGKFVIWGKVTVLNNVSAQLNVTAFMTTLDGATTLDSTVFIISAGLFPVEATGPLQSTLDLSQTSVNDIVDIRCVAAIPATAASASLIAIPVDALSGPVAPSY